MVFITTPYPLIITRSPKVSNQDAALASFVSAPNSKAAYRAPKMALPMRTMVEPSSTAMRQSPLIPIES